MKRCCRIFRAKWLVAVGLILLMVLPRLTALNQYVIVDEADRWRWAEEFVLALSRADLAATRVGDGYPGIVPVWAESIWVLLEAGRRSLKEGQWIGEPGLYLLFHEWDREAFLGYQRFPVVLLNTVVALAVVWAVWRLFGNRVAVVSGLLIALDPFYLSDSRVNRAEAVITGLMTLSILILVFFYQKRHWRYIILSGIFGGLSLLTKIQALAIAPAIALTGLLIYCRPGNRPDEISSRDHPRYARLPSCLFSLSLMKFGLVWIAAAGLTWVLLWPSMWVTPLETLALVYNYTTRKVGSEGVSLFFLGQTYLNDDPGFLFYPVVFFMRLTPLGLVGLIGAGLAGLRQMKWWFLKRPVVNSIPDNPFRIRGSAILVIFVLAYALAMTIGSHKQDRYLMPVFLSVNILAAMGVVYLWVWLKSGLMARFGQNDIGSHNKFDPYTRLLTPYSELLLFCLLVVIQLATILPHHPYYYSYFNPLFGGGQTAVRLLRVGWGEGMDQVGRYLAAKPNSRDLVVSTRFTHNMPDFKGKVISLGDSGRWTQADYVVLYVQQVQRRLDPSPEFIDYFQARRPEKVITIGDIDYAWIYPVPFTTPANPNVSQIPQQAALLGYRWEKDEPVADTGQQIRTTIDDVGSFSNSSFSHPRLRLYWKNLGLAAERQLVARLVGVRIETEWTPCQTASDFVAESQTPGRFLESLCVPDVATLPPDIYSVEFGLINPTVKGGVEAFVFPAGRHGARIRQNGQLVDTGEVERLDAVVAEAVPDEATRLDRIYDGRLRLAAYQLVPPLPQPGEQLLLTFYWQPISDKLGPIQLGVQLADSRSISLGRIDVTLFDPTQPEMARQWLPGSVIASRHQFELSPDLDVPLAAQVEVTLLNEAQVALRPTNRAGEGLDKVIKRFTVAPKREPNLANSKRPEANWNGGIVLRGYELSSPQARPGETLHVKLFWETEQPIPENYVVFVHLLDETGQLEAQSDSLPRAGAYPTPRWLPGMVVEDTHALTLSADLPAGVYQLVVGLYREGDGFRLTLENGADNYGLDSLVVPLE